MATIMAQEFAAAMTALLAAASARDARKWMSVASDVRELQSRCAVILLLIQGEAEADALAIDNAECKNRAVAVF